MLIKDNEYYDSDISDTDPNQKEELNSLENWNNYQIWILVSLLLYVSGSHECGKQELYIWFFSYIYFKGKNFILFIP